MRTVLLLIALGGALACSDSGVRRLPDAPTPPDAQPDAPGPLPAYEVTAGAKSLTGARFKADVQIGHPLHQGPVASPAKRVEGNAAVKP
ncbi:MAG TPA: hypothetical protein VK427_20065 [Kofleriaceae bacterium]|nr:hypothetical protein [Kofleriaceae bacterium]